MQVAAIVLEDGGVLGWSRGKVVQGFVGAGGEGGGGDVVAENSMIDDLREEGALGDQLPEHVRDVFLPLGREGLFVAGASAKGDDDHPGLFGICMARSGAKPLSAARRGKTHRIAKEADAGQEISRAARSRIVRFSLA